MIPVVGIGGGSGAGKSAIVRGLVDRLGASAIDIDSYYVDRTGLTREQIGRINFDEPGAIDVELLITHLLRLRSGEVIEKPVYSFTTHRRVAVEHVAPPRILVLEGLFTLWWDRLRALLDLKIFVDAPPDVRLARRLCRDLRERGRTVEQILRQYLDTVRPMHGLYVEPTRLYADLVASNDGPLDDVVDQVVEMAARTLAPTPPAEGPLPYRRTHA